MQSIRPHSPVEQDVVWIGEYTDGTYFPEFDFLTKDKNDFYSIDKDSLIRFGLVGHGHKFFYEVFGGTFNIDGHMIEFVYEENGKEYYLTGQNQFYRDIIQYKDAESLYYPNDSGKTEDILSQYNFGYKEKLEFDDMTINFKAIFSIPMYKGTPFFALRIVSDRDMNGKLKVRRNCILIDEFDAPLNANVGGEIDWVVK